MSPIIKVSDGHEPLPIASEETASFPHQFSNNTRAGGQKPHNQVKLREKKSIGSYLTNRLSAHNSDAEKTDKLTTRDLKKTPKLKRSQSLRVKSSKTIEDEDEANRRRSWILSEEKTKESSVNEDKPGKLKNFTSKLTRFSKISLADVPENNKNTNFNGLKRSQSMKLNSKKGVKPIVLQTPTLLPRHIKNSKHSSGLFKNSKSMHDIRIKDSSIFTRNENLESLKTVDEKPHAIFSGIKVESGIAKLTNKTFAHKTMDALKSKLKKNKIKQREPDNQTTNNNNVVETVKRKNSKSIDYKIKYENKNILISNPKRKKIEAVDHYRNTKAAEKVSKTAKEIEKNIKNTSAPRKTSQQGLLTRANDNYSSAKVVKVASRVNNNNKMKSMPIKYPIRNDNFPPSEVTGESEGGGLKIRRQSISRENLIHSLFLSQIDGSNDSHRCLTNVSDPSPKLKKQQVDRKKQEQESFTPPMLNKSKFFIDSALAKFSGSLPIILLSGLVLNEQEAVQSKESNLLTRSHSETCVSESSMTISLHESDMKSSSPMSTSQSGDLKRDIYSPMSFTDQDAYIEESMDDLLLQENEVQEGSYFGSLFTETKVFWDNLDESFNEIDMENDLKSPMQKTKRLQNEFLVQENEIVKEFDRKRDNEYLRLLPCDSSTPNFDKDLNNYNCETQINKDFVQSIDSVDHSSGMNNEINLNLANNNIEGELLLINNNDSQHPNIRSETLKGPIGGRMIDSNELRKRERDFVKDTTTVRRNNSIQNTYGEFYSTQESSLRSHPFQITDEANNSSGEKNPPIIIETNLSDEIKEQVQYRRYDPKEQSGLCSLDVDDNATIVLQNVSQITDIKNLQKCPVSNDIIRNKTAIKETQINNNRRKFSKINSSVSVLKSKKLKGNENDTTITNKLKKKSLTNNIVTPDDVGTSKCPLEINVHPSKENKKLSFRKVSLKQEEDSAIANGNEDLKRNNDTPRSFSPCPSDTSITSNQSQVSILKRHTPRQPIGIKQLTRPNTKQITSVSTSCGTPTPVGGRLGVRGGRIPPSSRLNVNANGEDKKKKLQEFPCAASSPASRRKIDSSKAPQTTKGSTRTIRKTSDPVKILRSATPNVGSKARSSVNQSSEQLKKLEADLSSRNKDLKTAEEEASKATLGVEALTVLVHYLVKEYDAFSTPQLKCEIEKLTNQINNVQLNLDETTATARRLEDEAVEKSQEYHNEIGKLQEEHSTKLASIAEEHRLEIEQTKEKHLLELREEKDQKQIQREQLIQAHKDELERIDNDWRLQVENQHERHLQSLKQLNTCHTQQIKDAEAAWEAKEKELHEANAKLLKEQNTLKAQAKKLEETLLSDKDHRLQAAKGVCTSLQNEVESLKTVVEMRNDEVHKLRDQLADRERLIDDLEMARERLRSLQAKTEDLNAQMEQKSNFERQMLADQHMMSESLQRETSTNKRLLLENEELQWKLRQREALMAADNLPTSTLDLVTRCSPLPQKEDRGSKSGDSSPQVTPRSQRLASKSQLFKNEHEKRWTQSFGNIPEEAKKLLRKSELQEYDELGAESPPASPRVKSVIEKSNSVSFILDLNDTFPEEPFLGIQSSPLLRKPRTPTPNRKPIQKSFSNAAIERSNSSSRIKNGRGDVLSQNFMTKSLSIKKVQKNNEDENRMCKSVEDSKGLFTNGQNHYSNHNNRGHTTSESSDDVERVSPTGMAWSVPINNMQKRFDVNLKHIPNRFQILPSTPRLLQQPDEDEYEEIENEFVEVMTLEGGEDLNSAPLTTLFAQTPSTSVSLSDSDISQCGSRGDLSSDDEDCTDDDEEGTQIVALPKDSLLPQEGAGEAMIFPDAFGFGEGNKKSLTKENISKSQVSSTISSDSEEPNHQQLNGDESGLNTSWSEEADCDLTSSSEMQEL